MRGKNYFVRLYVTDKKIADIVGDVIRVGIFKVTNSFFGMNGIKEICDGYCSRRALKYLIASKVKYFPLNNYGDFIITCPNCGEVIDDDMILTIYDENLLSGYNINCDRIDCGCQMADVEFKLD